MTNLTRPMHDRAVRLSLSVVICGYTVDRWEDIRAAVASLGAQTRSPDEVLFVADYNDELLERARTFLPGAVCLPNAQSKGLSGARNTGVAAARGDVIAFLDDDAVAEPEWALRLLEPYEEPHVIGVGGFVRPEWRAPRPDWFPDEFLWVIGCSYVGQPEGRAQVRNPIGANMSFRREVFDAAGGFDPSVGRIGKDAAGCEETEFAIRAVRGRPGRILLEPAAQVRHTVTSDRVTRQYFRRRCRAEGRSKALVSQLAGRNAALESERGYVLRTIPHGVLNGLRQLCRGEWAGGARAWALLEGTAITAVSYLVTRLRTSRLHRPAS